jgi:hypothetical protein
MLTVKEPTLSPAGIVAELLLAVPDEDAELVDDELDEADELQAAAVKVRIAARATQPSRGRGPLGTLASRRLYRCIAIATPPFGVGRLVG